RAQPPVGHGRVERRVRAPHVAAADVRGLDRVQELVDHGLAGQGRLPKVPAIVAAPPCSQVAVRSGRSAVRLRGAPPYHAGVTTRLASDGPQTVRADTIGAAWLAVAGRILTEGVDSRYDGLLVREISLVTLVVDHPGPEDEIIASRAEPERLAWMHANFTEHATVVAQLGRPAGRLLMIVKSAHVYETERGYLRDVLEGHH